MKRSFPLIGIEKVEYNEIYNPTIFRLIFPNFIEILQAEKAEEAKDWVEKITEGKISTNLDFDLLHLIIQIC